MNLKWGVIVIFSCLLTLCHTQTYSYPAQRRSSYSYRQPSFYSQSKTNYQTTSNRNFPVNTSAYYNTLSNPDSKSSYSKQSAQKNPYPYNSSTGYYKTTNKAYPVNRNYVATTPSQGYYRASSTYSNNAKGSYNSAANSATSKPYRTNSYNQNYNTKDISSGKYRITKADSENAKFAGASNQEDEEDGRTAYLKRRKLLRRFGNPCSPFGRDASNGVTPPPNEQGRFLWDINVYNVYPQTGGAVGCGGFGGGGGIAGGLLSDPIAAAPYYPPGTGLATFLSLFAPGILQNSLAATARPQQFADQYQQDDNNDLQSDPEVDPNYNRPAPLPVRRPNQILYDSAGAVSVV